MTLDAGIMGRLQHAIDGGVKHTVGRRGKNRGMAIKDRIQQRRKELEISVIALAQAVGVKPSAVYQWEDGTTKPSGNSIVKIAEALRTYEKWVSTGNGPKERGSAVALEPDEATLLLNYRVLPPDAKEMISVTAQQLADRYRKKSGNG